MAIRVELMLAACGIGLLAISGWEGVRCQETYAQSWNRPASPSIHRAPSDRIDPNLEDKIVYVCAKPVIGKPPRDQEFGVSVAAFRLDREVYRYNGLHKGVPEWFSISIDRPKTEEFQADEIQLGPYTLSGKSDFLMNSPADRAIRPERLKIPAGACWKGDELFLNGRPENPLPGDLKLTYRVLSATPLTVVGRQHGNKLEPGEPGDYLQLDGGERPLKRYLPLPQNPTYPWRLQASALAKAIAGLLCLLVAIFMRKRRERIAEDLLPHRRQP